MDKKITLPSMAPAITLVVDTVVSLRRDSMAPLVKVPTIPAVAEATPIERR